MKRSGEEFKKAAIKKGITHWDCHECGLCGYMCRWIFGENHEIVVFDHGCDCTRRYIHSTRTWDDVANNYNIQTSDEIIATMDKYWGFE